MTLRIGLVAGEASGDQLGAGLIRAIADRRPDAVFAGVGGPQMTGAGLEAWWPCDRLSVMGLAEVIVHLPQLLSLRRQLRRRFLQWRPDVVVGIDSPDFNLGLEIGLRRRGVSTVHYVSPSIWAWRPGRLKKIRRATGTVMCLLPFETAAYAKVGVEGVFVGHPLADRFPEISDRTDARRSLGLDPRAATVALLPGSRSGELGRLGPDFAGAAAWLSERRPELRFVAPMASEALKEQFASQLQAHGGNAPVKLLVGRSHQAMAASDVVLTASGTATLEAGLIKRPMVVAYRVAPLTAWVLRGFRMLKIDRFALPNLLAGRDLVPEILQDTVSPQTLGLAVLRWLDDEAACRALEQEFHKLHAMLRRQADRRAARTVLSICARGNQAS
ncbi:MAG: lipid-A-disaccharide synthase [Gammaproteobacteria bacterium]|jgi:lipid-A-disaccharide synthase